MTDPERTSLSGQIEALHARLDALDRHAQEREARHIERHDQVAKRLEAIAHDRREVERRIASLEAVRPQADRVAREAHEATDALHTQQGRREGREEVSETWWARLGVIAETGECRQWKPARAVRSLRATADEARNGISDDPHQRRA